MTKDDLQVHSHDIPKRMCKYQVRDAWWYEEPTFIEVVAECIDLRGDFVGATSVRIPWSHLRAALARLDKPAPKRKAKRGASA